MDSKETLCAQCPARSLENKKIKGKPRLAIFDEIGWEFGEGGLNSRGLVEGVW